MREKQYYSGLGPLFRQLIRNGIAHTFIAKPGIIVEKHTGLPLRIDEVEMKLYIDAISLSNDFQKSYFDYVKPLLEGESGSYLTSISIMQKRLDDLGREYSNNTINAFKSLKSLSSQLNRYIPGSRSIGSNFSSNTNPTTPFNTGGTISPFDVKPSNKQKK